MPDPTPEAPSLLGAIKAVLPKLVSRKLLVALLTKGSILALAWLAAHGVDHDIALHIIDVVVPTMAGTGAAYMVSQGMVDRAEMQADSLGSDLRASIDSAANPAPAAPVPVVAS